MMVRYGDENEQSQIESNECYSCQFRPVSMGSPHFSSVQFRIYL
jgi:hypothetical protein